MSGDVHGNLDGDGLYLIDGEEIHVEALVGDGMPLELVKDGGVSLAVVKLEVHDVGLRGVGETLEVTGVDGEEDVFHAETVKVARDEALTAESLDDGFVGGLTDQAFQFKMLHCLVFKMCYSG
jgi:hypothetical protein